MGYSNGVWILNDIANQLYSKKNIEARSIKIEDIDIYLTEYGKEHKDYLDSVYGCGKTQTYKNCYIPIIYKEQKEYKAHNSNEIGGITESESGPSTWNMPTDKKYEKIQSVTLEETAYFGLSFDTYYGSIGKIFKRRPSYWLATRYVDSIDSAYPTPIAGFGIRNADDWIDYRRYSDYDMFTTEGNENSYTYKLRVIVQLGPDVKVLDGDGSDDNPWHTSLEKR